MEDTYADAEGGRTIRLIFKDGRDSINGHFEEGPDNRADNENNQWGFVALRGGTKMHINGEDLDRIEIVSYRFEQSPFSNRPQVVQINKRVIPIAKSDYSNA